jgi:hypothetical protein
VTAHHPLHRFKLRATVDWIWFRITLSHPSQFRHVQSRLIDAFGKVYVRARDGNASSQGFDFRVQNPQGPDQFMRDIQSVRREGELPIAESSILVLGVEIALDAYLAGSDPIDLAWAAQYLFKHQAHPPAGPPRATEPAYFYAPILAAARDDAVAAHKRAVVIARSVGSEPPPELPKGSGFSPDVESAEHARQHMLDGLTINQGKAPHPKTWEGGDSDRSRNYVKTKDTKDGVAYAALPPDQWCARYERTLTGVDAPFTSIGGWRDFRFETLSKPKFAFVIPAEDRSPLVASLQERAVQLGRRPDAYKRRPSDRRQRRAFTRRDVVLNDRVRLALRALTRSQVCRNSVKVEPAPIPPSLEKSPGTGSAPKYLNTNTATTMQVGVDIGDQSKMTLPHPEVVWIKQRGPPP